jgi:mannosylglycoprotein endo-beta-mannosidase
MMILIQNTQEGLTNLKFLLLCFELLSSLKINFDKSEVIVMGVVEAEQARVARLLNCKQGKFPFTYLGFTMSDHKLTMADVEPLVASVGKRAASWQGRFMSSAARLTLIDACLSNLPLHTMGLFLLADGTHVVMDRHRNRFFWEGQSATKKFHMVNWKTICQPKSQDGLGVLNTKLMNIALMAKWIWRIYSDENSDLLWLRLLRAKYRTSEIFSYTPNSCSPFWRNIHKVKEHFRLGVRFCPGKNSSTSFWKDVWIGEVPLCSKFPSLFAKSSDSDLTIVQAYSEEGWRIFFRRALDQGDLQAWSELSALVEEIELEDTPTIISWRLTPSGKFSTKSLYLSLCKAPDVPITKIIWNC